VTAVPPAFPGTLALPLTHPRSGKVYTLTRADALQDTPALRADLTAACNEPLIYDWLFRERCGGQPYSDADAAAFLAWLRAGWRDGTHFVFALQSPCGRTVGALDIKSADTDAAEVGYWLSARHSGLMTLAVQALEDVARQAGYRSLYARVRPGNARSLNVTARAGWMDAGLEGDGHHRRFTRVLR